MAIEVKICGITRADDADAALRAGADYVGLNFHERSSRKVSLEAGQALAERLRGRTRLVAIFVDAGDDRIAEIVSAIRPDLLQLHGSESPARVGSTRARFERPVIKAIAVAEASDLSKLRAYEDAADMFLFDAKAPAGAAAPGGHGVAFDWQLLKDRRFTKPWFLSGGLKPDNVGRAIRTAAAQRVDAASGVETAPGIKDAELIRTFVEAARNAQFAAEAP